jgi:hypothetical protein
MTSLDVTLRRARLMARTTDSPASKQYWLERAAEIERELGLTLGGFAPVPPVRAAWFDRWENT